MGSKVGPVLRRLLPLGSIAFKQRLRSRTKKRISKSGHHFINCFTNAESETHTDKERTIPVTLNVRKAPDPGINDKEAHEE
jgi:hypothetical protein